MPAKLNLLGQKFGRWKVIGESEERSNQGGVLWLCQCECGTKRLVVTGHLRSGGTRSCGCLRDDKARNRIHDLTGKRFGRLIVTKRAKKFDVTTHRNCYWLCKCDCGNEKVIRSCSLVSGTARSCGCLEIENRTKIRESRRLSYGESMFKRLFHNYKRGADRRGLEFDLTKVWFRKLVQSTCFYCGTKPANVMSMPQSYGKFIYSGLDRKDNSRGYTLDNVVPCCWECNEKKRAMSYIEFTNWIKRLVDHNCKQLLK